MADVLNVKLSFLISIHRRWSALALSALQALFLSAAVFGAAPTPSDAPSKTEKFDTLTIGKTTFTNVTVLNKTRSDVFISHSAGMASLKVKELDTDVQLKLGYQVAPPRPKPGEALKKLMDASKLEQLEADPRAQQAAELVAERFQLALDLYGDRLIYGFVAAIILCYLSFSSLCRSICVKVAAPPKNLLPLVWLPLLKQIPMLQAAGMSPLWFLTNFVPGLFLITYIVWGFKISQARGKNPAVGVLFLLPVLNMFAVLYLAASSGVAGSSSSGNRNVIALQSSPKREAA